MADIGGLICFAGYFVIGAAALIAGFYFYMKSRGGEKELEKKMKETKDNV